MTPLCRLTGLIALLTLPAQPLIAQEGPMPRAEFDAALLETANEAGAARLPVSCGGLFRALRQIAPEDSETYTRFSDMEADMAFFASAMRRDETGEDLTVALDGVVPHMAAVSTLYLTRMRANKAATGKVLDAVITDNYQYCEGLNGRLLDALDKTGD